MARTRDVLAQKNALNSREELKTLGGIVDAKGNFKRDPNFVQKERNFIAKLKENGVEFEVLGSGQSTNAKLTQPALPQPELQH